MTPEQYEEWLLQAQGKELPESAQQEQPKPSPYKAAPLPDPMHMSPKPWGFQE